MGGSKQIGMGGVFNFEGSKYVIHVPLREFKEEVRDGSGTRDDYLRYYEMEKTPMTCMPVMLSSDPTGGSLNMMLEHPHFFTHDLKSSGHFEYDACAEEVRYVGYFSPVANVFCVNNPNIPN